MFHDQFLSTTSTPCRDSGTTFLCVDYLQGSFDDQTVRWNVTLVIDLVMQLELDLLKDIDSNRSYPLSVMSQWMGEVRTRCGLRAAYVFWKGMGVNARIQVSMVGRHSRPYVGESLRGDI